MITHLDHLVITVRDINKTIFFYTHVLGMTKELFADGRVALKFGSQKINLHELGKQFEPKAFQAMPGSADICLITNLAIEDALSKVKTYGVEIIEGIVPRTGANVAIESIYFRDPDGNLIEVSTYSNSLEK